MKNFLVLLFFSFISGAAIELKEIVRQLEACSQLQSLDSFELEFLLVVYKDADLAQIKQFECENGFYIKSLYILVGDVYKKYPAIVHENIDELRYHLEELEMKLGFSPRKNSESKYNSLSLPLFLVKMFNKANSDGAEGNKGFESTIDEAKVADNLVIQEMPNERIWKYGPLIALILALIPCGIYFLL
jgi:hypothetical protein